MCIRSRFKRVFAYFAVALCAVFALDAQASWTYSGTTTSATLTEDVESGNAWVLKAMRSSGNVTITGVTTVGDSTTLDFTTISGTATYVGKVKTLNTSAFYNNQKVVKIIAPYLTSIGQTAFQYCYNLTDVEWCSDANISISSKAFQSCTNLTLASHYNSERGCIDLDRVTSAATSAFSGCKAICGKLSLRNWFVDSTVQFTFSGCTGVTDVELQSNKVWTTGSISSSTPFGFTNAEEIHPFTRGAISPNIFKSITGLKRAVFGDDALSRETEGMSLGFSQTTQANGFCYNKGNLETIWLGNNVTNLYQYAFNTCKNVNSIRWPGTKPTIGAGAFTNLGSGEGVVLRQYFPGTNKDWRKEITSNEHYTAWNSLDVDTKAIYTNKYGTAAERPDGYCFENVSTSLKKGFVFFYGGEPPATVTVITIQ